ncbi:MAG: flagellar hook-associated protein FlgK [Sulfitobacter sp.]
MSITGAMNSAISGLRAAALGSEVVSNNISNALTPSYGQRSIELSSLSYNATGGVSVDGITRQVDESVIADMRLASASQQNAQTAVSFFNQLEDTTGLANDENSLSGRLAAFEESLISAASRPDELERLYGVVSSAQWLVDGINGAAEEIQDMRTEADAKIASDVETLNTALEQVERLNIQITQTLSRNGNSPALYDQRQAVLDTIGSIVPINVVPRDNGAVAIYSEGGAVLLDITAAEIGFEKQNTVTAYQTLDNGNLSGLTLNGQDLRISALDGGSLGGNFAVRDTYGVEAQTQLDALARDLIDRFSDPSLDTTRAVGDPGLFTDLGAAFVSTDEVGISARLSLNTAVDPDEGGEVWRIRDGMGATSSGPAGDSSLLNDLRSAMETTSVPASGGFGGGSYTSAELFSSFSASLATTRGSAEQDLTFAAAQLTETSELLLSNSVDTDQELQNLLLIERAYAANARVIQAANEMLEIMTGI